MCLRSKVKYALLMGRPVTSLLIGVSTFFPFYFGTGQDFLRPLTAACSMFFSGVFAFTVDDILGFPKDQKGGRSDKFLVIGKTTMRMAKSVCFASLVLSLVCAFVLGTTPAIMVAILLALLTVYPIFSSAQPALKNVFVAILCTYPALLTNFSQNSTVVPIAAVVVAAAFFFFRELAIDSLEISADMAAGMKTIPVRLQGVDF